MMSDKEERHDVIPSFHLLSSSRFDGDERERRCCRRLTIQMDIFQGLGIKTKSNSSKLFSISPDGMGRLSVSYRVP